MLFQHITSQSNLLLPIRSVSSTPIYHDEMFLPPSPFLPSIRNKVNDINHILTPNNKTINPQINMTLLQDSKLRRSSNPVNTSNNTIDYY